VWNFSEGHYFPSKPLESNMVYATKVFYPFYITAKLNVNYLLDGQNHKDTIHVTRFVSHAEIKRFAFPWQTVK